MSEDGTIEELLPASVDELFDLLRLTRTDYWGSHLPPRWVFRGQSDSSWELMPCLWRQGTIETYKAPIESIRSAVRPKIKQIIENPDNKLKGTETHKNIIDYFAIRVFEEIILEEFQDLWNDIGSKEINILHFTGWKNMLQNNIFGGIDNFSYSLHAVALAQHSGIPTRLLDWTLDPLKALVFALIPDNSNQSICIWCLDRQIIETMDALETRLGHGFPIVSFSKGSRYENSYLNAQDGCFTFIDFYRSIFMEQSGFPPLEQMISAEATRKKCISPSIRKIIFKIDSITKTEIRLRLYRDRKTLFHLMPSLERCAEVAKANMALNLRRDRTET